jgi:hypothetical protein
VGPLKSLKLKAPGAEAEKIFIQSFDTSLAYAAAAMRKLQNGNLVLTNIDYDTGKETARGEYNMADVNYDKLLLELAGNNFRNLNDPLRQHLLAFYRSAPPQSALKTKPGGCRKISAALLQLKAL